MNTNNRIGKRVALSALLFSFFIISISSRQTALGQGLCSNACAGVYSQLAALKSERTSLQSDLKNAAPGEKPFLNNQIRKLNKKITAKEAEYVQCELAHDGKPTANTTFVGKAVMSTNNSKASGPYVKNVTIKGVFPRFCHDALLITDFPPIVVGPYSTPVGDNTTTVTLVEETNSSVDPSTGRVQLTVKLHFHHSLAVAKDSDLIITLSTDAPGGTRRTDAGRSPGAIVLVGNGTFIGGYLGDNTCHLQIAGTINPGP